MPGIGVLANNADPNQAPEAIHSIRGPVRGICIQRLGRYWSNEASAPLSGGT